MIVGGFSGTNFDVVVIILEVCVIIFDVVDTILDKTYCGVF